MDIPFVIHLALSSCAVFQAAGMLLQTYEHARYGRSRLRSKPTNVFQPRVEVFLPCKGVDSELDTLVRAILTQDYPAYGVTFVVESADDPALKRLQALLPDSSPILTRILIAGPADACGQKVHNLLVATESLPPSVNALAFLDSDIQIESDWLSRLIEPLQNKKVGAVTGYRWFMPVGNSVVGAVLSALNAGIAFAAGNHSYNAIWGGSWSILRSTFEAAGIRQAWEGAITEDLSASKAIRRAGLRVVFEPNCLVVSPVRYNARAAIEFVRRQYLITRVYAPGLHWLMASGAILYNLTFWGGMALGGWRLFLGRPVMWTALLVASLYGLGALRAAMRQSFVADRFPAWREFMSRSRRLDILAGPLLVLCNLALILSSAAGKHITWRGIHYRMNGPHQTRVLPRTASRRRQNGFQKAFDYLEGLRAVRIARRLDRHLEAGETLLDFGCGSQIVAAQIQRSSKVQVLGLDTLAFSKRDLPMVLYDGIRAPFEDGSFDVVLISFVLHHCEDGGASVLREARRLARKKILLLEDSYDTPAERLIIRLVDKSLNWLEDPRIPVPYRFRPSEEWQLMFRDLGLALTGMERVQTTPILNTRQILFVLTPQRCRDAG